MTRENNFEALWIEETNKRGPRWPNTGILLQVPQFKEDLAEKQQKNLCAEEPDDTMA